MHQCVKEIWEVVKLATKERGNERIVEVLVPHFREETVVVAKLVPHERASASKFRGDGGD